MDDLNDILTGLEEDININTTNDKILLKESKKINTNDIFNSGNKILDTNIRNKKNLFVLKNKTKIFDSAQNLRRLKDIYLVKKKSSFLNIKNNLINIKNLILKISNTGTKKTNLSTNTKNKLKTNAITNYNFKIKTDLNINKNIKSNFSKKFINNSGSGFNIFGFRKKIIGYIFILFAFTLLFYFIIGLFLQNYLNNGYSKLLHLSKGDINNNTITEILDDIKNDFNKSDILIKPFLIIPNKNIENIYYIIKGGKSLSFFLNDSYFYYKSLNKNLLDNGINKINLIELLNDSKYIYNNFSSNLESTIYYYDKVGDLFKDDIKNKFNKSRIALKNTYKYLTLINRNFETLKGIFGNYEEKKYLILFQNNDEIRPTGGFIGSLGLVNILDGKITNIKNDDIYAYEWEINKFYKDKINAPEGINRITEKLGIRDSNYKIGFIESSYQMKYFLDFIDKDIDGVIYINQNIILDLLDITGDIYFDKIGEKINSQNFSAIISSLTESKKFKVGTLGTPKQILFDFSELFLQKIIEVGNYPAYSKILFEHVLSRDIVINSFNTKENSLLWKLGLDGSISYFNNIDFNYPVFMSIGGGKTDRYSERTFTKSVNINNDCSIDTSLNIIQKHHFTSEDENYLNILFEKFEITDKNILFIQGKTDNKQFVQVVIPKDAIIKNNNNYIIEEKANSKIVKFYTKTRRLETVNNKIEYTLLNSNCSEYNFTFYKQAGIKNYNLEINYNGVINSFDGLKKDFNFN